MNFRANMVRFVRIYGSMESTVWLSPPVCIFFSSVYFFPSGYNREEAQRDAPCEPALEYGRAKAWKLHFAS